MRKKSLELFCSFSLDPLLSRRLSRLIPHPLLKNSIGKSYGERERDILRLKLSMCNYFELINYRKLTRCSTISISRNVIGFRDSLIYAQVYAAVTCNFVRIEILNWLEIGSKYTKFSVIEIVHITILSN